MDHPVVDRGPRLDQGLAAAQSRAVALVVDLLREEKVELVVCGHGDALGHVQDALGELGGGLGVFPVPVYEVRSGFGSHGFYSGSKYEKYFKLFGSYSF